MSSVEIYPVVHVRDEAGALEQSALAFEAQADGVYLIDHHGNHVGGLLSIFEAVKRRFPDRFVGVNILQAGSSARALKFISLAREQGFITEVPDGLWVDDGAYGKEEARGMRVRLPELRKIRLLGGAAFKYTTGYTSEAGKAAFQAADLAPYVDVVTTSGEQTGAAPNPDKIRAMKAAIGDRPLAIASGVSVTNIDDYRGAADQLLVASSIETAPYSGVFDPLRLQELVAYAHDGPAA